MIERIKTMIAAATVGQKTSLARTLLAKAATASLDVIVETELKLAYCPPEKRLWLLERRAYALHRVTEALRELSLLHGGDCEDAPCT